MKKTLLFLFFFIHSIVWGVKLPEINSSDAATILRQMMQAHVAHKELSTPLIQRALEGYVDELDPMKCYFLEEEVTSWLHPTEERLAQIKQELEKNDFIAFEKIHEGILKAIQRRSQLERQASNQNAAQKISVKDFKELSWAKNEEELTIRLAQLQHLQHTALDKLEPSLQQKALQRIQKRQQMREEELLCKEKETRLPLVLSYALKAFASAFDSHTAYFTPLEASQFMIQVQQRLFGIGAQLRDDITGFRVVKIIEGGPASKNPELKEGDLIIAIDKEPVVGLEIMDAVELVRGPDHTSVLLTVLRECGEKESTHHVEIIRGEVVIQEARFESKVIPFGDGVIAHLVLHAFYQDPMRSSASDIADALEKIQKEHFLKGIILDVRTNAGGVLPQAVAVTGLFITKGIVVSIKDNQGKIEHLRNIDGKLAYDGPIVVLTSKASASASEIVAQTLQDYGRAIVVGDPHTYGKGSFQTFTYDAASAGPVNPKGEFKVTRGCYYTVSGKSPQLVGVIPDIIVPGSCSQMEIGEQYTKHPLATDQIAAHFDDDLSDIPARQRAKIDWLYRLDLQKKITTYTDHIPLLAANSAMRIQKSPFYQKILSELTKQEECNIELVQAAHEADLQLNEAIHILQDLIVLLK